VTINPIFDQLSSIRRRASFQAPDQRATPLYASIATAPVSKPARAAAPVHAAAPATIPADQPRPTHDDLSADEREIIAEMGGTVARLILQMLDEDTTSKRRWPFHPVR
jgi:hypothetical protein